MNVTTLKNTLFCFLALANFCGVSVGLYPRHVLLISFVQVGVWKGGTQQHLVTYS